MKAAQGGFYVYVVVWYEVSYGADFYGRDNNGPLIANPVFIYNIYKDRLMAERTARELRTKWVKTGRDIVVKSERRLVKGAA